MRTLLPVAALPLLLVGCARSTTVAPASTALAASPPPALVGEWHGVITGREMATAAGVSASPARLTVRPDGTFTLQSPNGVAEGRAVPRGGSRIALDGRYVTPREAPADAALHAELRREGTDGLGGRTDAYFLGHEVTTGIQLKKVQ